MPGVVLGRARIADAGLNKACVPTIELVQRRRDAVDVGRRDHDPEVAIADDACDGTFLGQREDRASKPDVFVELCRDLHSCMRLHDHEDMRRREQSE